MKTVITIPDAVFEAAEQAARRLGMSRSELYTRAVEVYLKDQGSKGVTEKMNEAFGSEDTLMDPVLVALQWSSLKPKIW